MDHRKRVGGLLFAGTLAAAAAAVADELFLKIDGVPGDSIDARHKDEINVLSYSQGNTGPFAQGGGGPAGKTTCGPVKITKYLDRSSPRLMFLASNGQHLPRATISFRRAGSKDGNDYYRVTLDDVVVTDVQQTGDGGSRYAENAREAVSLIGRRIAWDYLVQGPTGAPLGTAKSFWDCVAGKGG